MDKPFNIFQRSLDFEFPAKTEEIWLQSIKGTLRGLKESVRRSGSLFLFRRKRLLNQSRPQPTSAPPSRKNNGRRHKGRGCVVSKKKGKQQGSKNVEERKHLTLCTKQKQKKPKRIYFSIRKLGGAKTGGNVSSQSPPCPTHITPRTHPAGSHCEAEPTTESPAGPARRRATPASTPCGPAMATPWRWPFPGSTVPSP